MNFLSTRFVSQQVNLYNFRFFFNIVLVLQQSLTMKSQARMLSVISCANIPKITVVMGNGFGSSHYLMVRASGKVEGKRDRGKQRITFLDSLCNSATGGQSKGLNFLKLYDDRDVWRGMAANVCSRSGT